ncbi:MAG TPA: hypothetical protein PLV65_02190 [Tenuifilaceae bacterium]|nr:hypothetical protein [Tenuifilaceae bacterium]
MKRILLLSLILLPFAACFAQVKVVESSARRAPGWVNGLEKDYIIVVGSAANIQDAQQNALNMVKERIVSSVAENVKTSSEMKMQESTINNISTYLENFATTTTTTSGPVPFLQGVSLSKVEEFYWEKTENKTDRSVRYNYHIKYPFPHIEMWKLVEEFKKRDRELTEQLDELLASVDNVASVEDIERSIGELKVLADYFMDGRKDKAVLGITRYSSLFDGIELVELESDLGMLKYALRLGDKYIESTRKPQVRSECARITGTINNKEHTIINYDYFNCYEDPENHIMVTYRFGNNTVRKPFYFDITADKAAIFVNEPFHFKALSTNEGVVEGATLDIVLVSKYAAPFTVNKVVLEFPGQTPVVVDNISESYQGKGNHALKLMINDQINVEKTSTQGKRISMLSGYIHFKSDKTGEMKTYRIYNHNYTTNW